MGLSGRKQKQRIPADPRNLGWADDASRFGLSYLSKFGWDTSKGLGSSGDGMKTHIKVQQKLDMMGIGAQHQRDPNGIAWKQNKDFEALLKRLNESGVHKEGDGVDENVEKPRESAADDDRVEEDKDDSLVTTKKRKSKDGDDKRMKKQKRDKERSDSDVAPEDQSGPVPKPRPMAHRARIRAAKRIAGKSASAISEILGIAPPSSTSTSAPTPTTTPLPSSTPTLQPPALHDNLTTSTKSLADYFKEKLLSRSSSSSSPASSSLPSGSATPGLGSTGLGFRLSNPSSPEDSDEPPRRGIGSQLYTAPSPTQVPDLEPASRDDDCNADLIIEDLKQRRKAEHKAEKRRQQGAESVAVSEDRVMQDGEESIQRKPRKKRKEKQLEEQKQGNDASEGGYEQDTAGGSLSEPNKKSKKEHKKKRS